jgi:hypothetical protein
MSIHSRYVNVSKKNIHDAIKEVIGEHLGQPLPDGTEIVYINIKPGDEVAVELSNPEFGELPPGASHELKPQGKKQ